MGGVRVESNQVGGTVHDCNKLPACTTLQIFSWGVVVEELLVLHYNCGAKRGRGRLGFIFIRHSVSLERRVPRPVDSINSCRWIGN